MVFFKKGMNKNQNNSIWKLIQTTSQIESLPCSGIKFNVISWREQTQSRQITSRVGLSVGRCLNTGHWDKLLGLPERFPSREDIDGLWLGTVDREQWSVWSTASPISPAARAQTTKETSLFSHSTTDRSSRKGSLAEPPAARLLSLSCSERRVLTSTGYGLRPFQLLTFSLHTSHVLACGRACALDWFGLPKNKICCLFDLFLSLMKFHWQKRFLEGGKRCFSFRCWPPLILLKQA